MIAVGETPCSHVTLRPEVKYVGNMHGDEVSFHYHFQKTCFLKISNYLSIKRGNAFFENKGMYENHLGLSGVTEGNMLLKRSM